MLSDGDGDNSNSQTTSAKNDGIQIELDEKAVKELLKHSRFGDLLQQQKQQSFPTLDGKREEELEGEEDWQTEVRRELNRRERELLENTHRVHVLLAIAHLRFLVCSVLVGPSSSEQLTKALESLSNSLYMKSSAPVGSHPTTAQQMLALAKRFSREFSRLLESGGEMMEKPGLEAVAAMEYCPERLRRVAELRSYSSDWELPAVN